MDKSFQLQLLHLQADMHTRLRTVQDVHKAVFYGLRRTRELFQADRSVMAVLRSGQTGIDLNFAMPKKIRWDIDLLTRYLKQGRPKIPDHTLLAPIRRRGRNWAVLAFRLTKGKFTSEHRQALLSITQILTDIVRRVDTVRTRRVRLKIERNIADRQEPKDLIYNILHGLRSLIRYDHSASLFISKDGQEALELVAEQIAWTKAKSQKIGQRLEFDKPLERQLRSGGVHLYKYVGGTWRPRQNSSVHLLPPLLAPHTSSNQKVPDEVAMLCAPIVIPGGALVVLKLSARREGLFGEYEARLVEEFIPITSLAVQLLVRTETLHERVLQSERKHVLANLTRGITHDVNNALGAMMPLVQQMREDAANNQLEAETVTQDLQSLEASIQTCRRIFGSMLTISRGSVRGVGHGNLRRAIDGALNVLEDSLKRRNIQVLLDLPDELPTIRGSQGDLTQIFLNFCTNARDAMSDGGKLHIIATPNKKAVRVSIQDTGCGIPAEKLTRVLEPFYTTKAEGSGLGLSICRSVLYDIGGDLTVHSIEGEGTRLDLTLPVLPVQEDAE